MPRLLLVRHGRTSWNVVGRGQGHTDVPLDEVGREQAAEIGPMVAAAGPAAVWSSDSARARDTATQIGLPVHTDRRLREINLGTFEGLTPAAWKETDAETYRLWRSGHDVRRGGGETYAEVGVRARAALTEALATLTDPRALLVLVAHGGTIRSPLHELLALPPSPWSKLAGLDDCHCAMLYDAMDDRGWRLARYGGKPDFLVRPDG